MNFINRKRLAVCPQPAAMLFRITGHCSERDIDMQQAPVVIDDISKLTRRMRTVFDKMVREKGLTFARARILRRLGTTGIGTSQRALAEELDIGGATLGRLLDNLEQNGLVARTAVAGDRRAHHVVLTEAGKHQATEVGSVAAAFRSSLLDGIDPEHVDIVTSVVAQMQKNLDAVE